MPWVRGSGRCAEAGLWLIGLLCAVVLVKTALGAHRTEVQASQIGLDASPNLSVRSTPAHPGQVLGRVAIPALSFEAPIVEGDEPAALRIGVGHISGTAEPGGLGNVVLAGHRDTYFRPLQRAKVGMILTTVTEAGAFQYVVDTIEIVHPQDVRVLQNEDHPGITLITCYPFHFVGAAPERFVVRGHLVSDPG